ncbi:MAG: hypothetical protein WCK26_02025 [Candidatus Saccharibacteria bacterium]
MKELNIIKVRIGSLVGFYATGFGIVGLIVSLLFAMSNSLHYGVETASLLKGMVFGVTAGFVEVVFITAVYAIIGAIVGFMQAVIFNIVSGASGGIVITTKEQK